MNPAKKHLKGFFNGAGVGYYLFSDGITTNRPGAFPAFCFRFYADGYIAVTDIARNETLLIKTHSITILFEKMLLHKFITPQKLLPLLYTKKQKNKTALKK